MTRMAFNGVLDANVFLHRCARCSCDLDRHGKLCRKCHGKRMWKNILGTAAALELFVAAAIAIKPLKLPSSIGEDVAAEQAPPAVQRVVADAGTPAGPTGWLYFNSSDPLIGDVTHHARLLGNAAQARVMTAPNQQLTTGVLELSSSQHYGRQVLVSFPRIATACDANPCTVRAAFDTEPAQAVGFSDLSEGSSTVLALKDFDRLTSAMAHAQSLTITASMGMAKETVLSFNVTGFKMQLAQWMRAHPVRLAAMDARARAD